jgi:lipopolysaccharide assembly protein B
MDLAQQFVLLVAAIAVGWLLGRYSGRTPSSKKNELSPNYYRELSFLFSEEPGPAVMSVIDNLPVNQNSLPTHLALGNLLRDKGEIEGATRIHQNLLAHKDLPAESLHEVHLELARDYISAGLLDRAERLLRDLIDEDHGDRKRDALEYLQHIYQSERDWEKAIAVARQRLPKAQWFGGERDPSPETRLIKHSLSHYYCELAEAANAEGDTVNGERYLSKALQYQCDNVRAVILQARQQLHSQPQRVVNLLESLMRAQVEYVAEALPVYRQAFEALPGRPSYVAALETLVADINSSTLQLELIQELLSHGEAELAKMRLSSLLSRRPTLNLLAGIHNLPIQIVEPGVVRESMASLRAGRPAYRCKHCGFSGQKLHWLCPGCEQWGTIAPIRGSEGD